MIRRNSFKIGSGSGSSQKITIRLLDDNEVLQVDFQGHHKGQFLMDYVCRQLNIAEKDYFGLRYVDANKQRHWMDLGKSITKQLKEMTPFIICLRFKFYPSDPMLLKENVTRYQLVLQLRRDILHGRLYSAISDMATLSSYIIQSELGDYNPEIHTGNYVAEYELVSRQTAELEEKVIELHPELKGLTASEADVLFLKKAQSLDTYGIDPHPVKSIVKVKKLKWFPLKNTPIYYDQQGEQIFVGINHTGISTFQGSKKSTHFKWPQITKLNFEAKMFIIHVSIAEDSRTKKKETVGFKCHTSSSCKYLWRCAVEQRLFFNCGSATEIPSSVRGGGIFGSRFRYSGKVQREILDDPGPLRASDGVIQRTPLYRSLQRNKTRSLPHSPLQLGYGSLPRSNHSAPSEGTRLEGLPTLGSSNSLPLASLSSPYCPEQTLPLLEVLEEDSPRDDDKVEDVDTTLTGIEQSFGEDTPLKIESPDQGGSGDRIENGPSEYLSLSPTSREGPSTLLVSIQEEHESEIDIPHAVAKDALQTESLCAVPDSARDTACDTNLDIAVAHHEVNNEAHTSAHKVNVETVKVRPIEVSEILLRVEKEYGTGETSSTVLADQITADNNNSLEKHDFGAVKNTRKIGIVVPPILEPEPNVEQSFDTSSPSNVEPDMTESEIEEVNVPLPDSLDVDTKTDEQTSSFFNIIDPSRVEAETSVGQTLDIQLVNPSNAESEIEEVEDPASIAALSSLDLDTNTNLSSLALTVTTSIPIPISLSEELNSEPKVSDSCGNGEVETTASIVSSHFEPELTNLTNLSNSSEILSNTSGLAETEPISLNKDENIAFFPVSGSDGLAENCVGEKDNLLRESKIDQVSTSSSAISKDGKSVGKQQRIILSMWKVFLVCMICVLIALLCVAVLAIEVDVDICQRMRRIPEVELFQNEVYEPIKYFIRDKIQNISNNLKLTFQ